jgi:hypothetical protein
VEAAGTTLPNDPVDLQMREFENQIVIKISFSGPSAEEWCAGIERLRDETISLFQIRQRMPSPKMAYSLQRRKASTGPASIRRGLLEAVIEMNDAQLGYVYNFLRRYQQQGAASVDHVDVEATELDGKEAYLTFSVPKADTPMTPDEAAAGSVASSTGHSRRMETFGKTKSHFCRI